MRDNPELLARDDEIDLVALCRVLWSGRWIVVGIVLFAAVVSAVVLFNMQDIYRVEARIEPSSHYQLEQIQPTVLKDAPQYQLPKVDVDKLYDLSLAYFGSSTVRVNFWESTQGVKLPAIGEPSNDELQAFKRFANAVNIKMPDGKSDSKQVTLSIESPVPAEAATRLAEYITFVNRYTMEQQLAELAVGYSATIKKITSNLETLENQKQQELADQLTVLTEARDMAESLGVVDTPYEKVENVGLTILDNRLYLLGTRVLNEEINALKAREGKPLASFDPDIRLMEQWQAQLQQDFSKLAEVSGQVNAFKVINEPEISLEPVKPQRLLILIAAMFLAGFVGVVVVFIRHALICNKQE